MVEPPALLTASAALNAFHVPVVAVTPGFYARWFTYIHIIDIWSSLFLPSLKFLTSLLSTPDSLQGGPYHI